MMRRAVVILAGMVLLAGCSLGVPGFLGREGSGRGTFGLGGDAPPTPDPVPLPLRTAEAERALHGVILRAEGVSPTQGYYEATLLPLNGGNPDAAGIVSFELVAVPPFGAQAVGPERTRVLRAAVFYPNRALKSVTGFRVKGGANVLTVAAPRPPVAPPVLATDIPEL